MTEKIIIDGVDVSGCKLYDKTTHQLEFNKKCGHICKDTECKYKRLWYKKKLQTEKEKVKELEEKYKVFDDLENWYKSANLPQTEKGLKQRLFEAESIVKELERDLKQVQNENLKEIVELIRKNELEDNIVFQLLDIEGKKKDKYKQTLKEILEISKQTCRKRCTNDCLGTRRHCGYGQILQKCEVLENE